MSKQDLPHIENQENNYLLRTIYILYFEVKIDLAKIYIIIFLPELAEGFPIRQ